MAIAFWHTIKDIKDGYVAGVCRLKVKGSFGKEFRHAIGRGLGQLSGRVDQEEAIVKILLHEREQEGIFVANTDK
jgi:hypothetical protein